MSGAIGPREPLRRLSQPADTFGAVASGADDATAVDAALAKLTRPPATDAALAIARRARLQDPETAKRFIAAMKNFVHLPDLF